MVGVESDMSVVRRLRCLQLGLCGAHSTGAASSVADLPTRVEVAVVGAGLAGLSAAIFLRAKGVAVTLLDRHTTLEDQGVETTVGVLFQECYRKSGVDLTEDLNRIGVPISFYVVRDGEGNISSRERVDATAQSFGRRSYDVSRPELMRVLLGKFEAMGGVFRGGSAVESVDIVEKTARIRLADSAEVIETQSLIACDGIHSHIRRQLFDDVPPQYPGVSLVYGILPGAAGLIASEPDSFQMMLADGFSVLTSHYTGERPETWFAVLSRSKTPLLNRSVWTEGKDEAEAGAVALLSSGPPLLRQFLEHDPPPRFTYSGGLQTREMDASFQWARGPVLLIGDAVHGLTPWGGYSGQMAVEDAFVVAQHHGNPNRFADIVADRRARVLKFQNKSTEQKADGLGDAEAVARAHLERIEELVSCPAFEMHVFVVGIAGRIGSAVAKACLARGARVSGLARDPAAAAAACALNISGSLGNITVYQGDAADTCWAEHLQGVDAIVCALRGMPGELLPLQMHVLQLAVAAGIPRFVAADFLPDYTPLFRASDEVAAQLLPAEEEEDCTPPSASVHPILAERVAFRKLLRNTDGIAGVHVHIGCLLEIDELFGFMGLWDEDARTLSYWADCSSVTEPELSAAASAVPFDVTTVHHAADATAEALFTGVIGDVRIATATVTMRDIADAINYAGEPVTLRHLGTLKDLEETVAATPAGSLESIRLHCQRSLFAGDCNVVGASTEGLRHWLNNSTAAKQLLYGPPPQPWTTPNMEAEGLIQTDLKTDGIDGDTALRALSLSGNTVEFETAWLELGRRALTAGRWAEARFVAEVIRTVDPSTYTSGKLWFAGVACFFTGDFEDGVARFDAEMASNPVDAEELLWRELCCIAGGRSPSCKNGSGGHQLLARLAKADPRRIFNRILEYFDGLLPLEALLQLARAEGPLERFYVSLYAALHLQALGEAEASSRRLLRLAQRQQCRDNLGLACSTMRILPYVKLGHGAGSGYSCPRLIVGCAGLDATETGVAASIQRLQAAAAKGLCAVDVADIYPGSEQLAR